MRHSVERFFLVVVLAIALATAWLKPLDVVATEQVDAGLKRALVSFATARALNAIISVAQGTDIAIQPAGVGVKLAPGQILRPVNDLVGQFAEMMLAASVAFGAIKVLISIGSFWGISLLTSAVAIAWFAVRWRGADSPSWLTSAMLVLLMVRFAVPLVTVGSDAVFHKFLSSDYAVSQSAIDGNAEQLASLSPPSNGASAGSGVIGRINGWLSQGVDAVGSRLEKLKHSASQVTEHIVKLIVVFLMQTVVVPLFLFWALYRIGKAALDQPLRIRPRNS
jgi:hypothetical protein